MPSIDVLHTGRLIGERPRAEDFSALRRLHQDPKVIATLSTDGGLLLEEQTRLSLQRSLDHWDLHGFGVWMFRTHADDQFAGYCGIRHVQVDGKGEIELLYAVLSDCWRQGLATEMTEAVLTVAFERLGLKDVVAYTLPANRASRRVMEKQGFSYERDIVHASLPHVLYRLTAAAWKRGS